MDKILEEYLEVRKTALFYLGRLAGTTTYFLHRENEAIEQSVNSALDRGYVLIPLPSLADSGLARFLHFPAEDLMSDVEN